MNPANGTELYWTTTSGPASNVAAGLADSLATTWGMSKAQVVPRNPGSSWQTAPCPNAKAAERTARIAHFFTFPV